MRHSELLDLLQFLIKVTPKQKDIAEALGIKLGAIGTRASRNSFYNIGEILKIGEYFDIPQDKMLEKMFCDTAQKAGILLDKAKENIDNEKVIDFLEKKKYIDKLAKEYVENPKNSSLKTSISATYFSEAEASCGNGKYELSGVKELISIPKCFIRAYSSAKTYSVINASGESMFPTIQNRDLLIVEHTNDMNINDNDIYVFCYEDQVYVKRLVKNIDELIIKSDNQDPSYSTKILKKEDMNKVYIIGRIVGLMRNMD